MVPCVWLEMRSQGKVSAGTRNPRVGSSGVFFASEGCQKKLLCYGGITVCVAHGCQVEQTLSALTTPLPVFPRSTAV